MFHRVGARIFPLHPAGDFYLTGEAEAEAVEENRLVVGGAGDAAAADLHLFLPGGEDDVDQADFAQFLEDSTRLVAEGAGRSVRGRGWP